MNRPRPRFLVEGCDYVLQNIGDMAMLLVAIERLRALSPDATIQVLTDVPAALEEWCPTASPFPARGRHLWLEGDRLRAGLRKVLPLRSADAVRRSIPGPVADVVDRFLGAGDQARLQKRQFVRAVQECDLLIVPGMGGITDAFPDYAIGVLETMELALQYGRPVAMVGQGIGPLDDPQLRARAASVLPRIDLIALRERRAGEPLLLALGVEPQRTIVTGDDALQVGYDLRCDALGSGLGVNLRLADYAGIDAESARSVGEVLRDKAAEEAAPLIPIPISLVDGEADLETLRTMLPNALPEVEAATALCSPADIVRQVQRCRVVVTGSYHAGVFALGAGIPVVAIVGSRYYEDKFRGLSDMFGVGCEVVMLRDKDFSAALRVSISRLWTEADELRPHIYRAAKAQIAAGHAAYRKVARLALDN